MIGRALGGTTSRLRFGHHGGNHPVKDLRTGKIAITAQNHNYQVDTASLDPAEVEITHVSLNDGSLEGCGSSAGRCFACSITRKPRPVRTMHTICLGSF